MSYTRPFPLDGNESGWMANAGSIINSHNLTAGNGIALIKTANGVQISATHTRQINYLTNKGYYDFNNEYWPGDVVFVDPIKTYNDQTGAPISQIAAGGFVCVTYVPPGTNDFNYFLSTAVPALTSNGGQATDIIANTFRWYQQNIYYPNTNPIVAVTTHAQSGYNIYASQSFWQPIGGAAAGINYATFDESASYSKGTMVWVDPLKTYSIPFEGTASGNFPPLAAGAFFVIKDIPAAVSGSRPSGNLYYPFYPPIPAAAEVTISGSTYNSNYFGAITPLNPDISFCAANGEPLDGFSVFIPSGSTYVFSLPHP
jgi:hypothetical protein